MKTIRRNFCLGAAAVAVMAVMKLGGRKNVFPPLAGARSNDLTKRIMLKERLRLGFPVEVDGFQSYSFATGVVWSPDGSRIAAIGNYGASIAVWTSTGTEIAVIDCNVVNGPYDGSSLAFISNDIIATPATDSTNDYSGRAFTLWSVSNRSVLEHIPGPAPGQFDSENEAKSFQSFGHGQYIVAPLEQAIWVCSTKDWTTVARIPWHEAGEGGEEQCIAVSPDGKIAAVGTLDGSVELYGLQPPYAYHGTLVVYPQGTNTPYPLVIWIASLAFSPDGQFLAVGADGSIGLSVINGGSTETESPPAALAHAPVQIWRVKDWTIVSRYPGHLAPVSQLTWSSNSAFLAAAAGDDSIRVFAPGVPLDPVASVIGVTGISSVSFSPIDDRLAVTSDSGITLYDIVPKSRHWSI